MKAAHARGRRFSRLPATAETLYTSPQESSSETAQLLYAVESYYSNANRCIVRYKREGEAGGAKEGTHP